MGKQRRNKMECKISKANKLVELGSFQMVSGTARVSDPCYDLDTWCAGDVKNCKKGKWNSLIEVKDEGEYGNRVGLLYAIHSSLSPYNSIAYGDWDESGIKVGVDSGQGGIFDKTMFKKDDIVKGVKRTYKGKPICEDEPWYSICCDRTLGEKSAGVIPGGCVSSSGFGDGEYICRTLKKNHKVVGIMIDYCLND